MPEFRNGRQIRYYIIRKGASYQIIEATDAEMVYAGKFTSIIGVPLDTLEEAAAMLVNLDHQA